MVCATTAECVDMLLEMIEEVQREALYATSPDDWRVMISKRDALTELKFRLRDGCRDDRWARHVPQAFVLHS